MRPALQSTRIMLGGAFGRAVHPQRAGAGPIFFVEPVEPETEVRGPRQPQPEPL